MIFFDTLFISTTSATTIADVLPLTSVVPRTQTERLRPGPDSGLGRHSCQLRCFQPTPRSIFTCAPLHDSVRGASSDLPSFPHLPRMQMSCSWIRIRPCILDGTHWTRLVLVLAWHFLLSWILPGAEGPWVYATNLALYFLHALPVAAASLLLWR